MTVINIFNQEICIQDIAKMTIKNKSVQNIFIEKQSSCIRTNRELHKTHLASFSSSQDFPTWQKIAKWKKSAKWKILQT